MNMLFAALLLTTLLACARIARAASKPNAQNTHESEHS